MSIYTDDSVKSLKFLYGNNDITAYVKAGSFSAENILNDGQITFGSCNSARAEFVIIEDLNLKGEQVTIQYGNGSTWTNLGTYKINSANIISNSMEIKCIGYDCIKHFDADVSEWYVGLNFPMTLKAFRDSLCAHIGITQVERTLVNDTMQVHETLAPSKLNAKEVLSWIGEINGVFPHASDWSIDWVSLGTIATTITASVVQGAKGVKQKDYSTKPILKVVVRGEDGDIGAYYGAGPNTYYVTANPLCYGMTATELTQVATNLYSKIEGITYTPTTISMKCDPTIPMGAKLKYGETYFYLMSRSTSGLLFDEIKCEGKEEIEEDSSVETSVEQLRGKTNVLTRDVEQTNSRIENIEDDYTTHTEFVQTADALQVEIRQIESQLDGDIELFYVDEPPTLLNYPAWDWTGMYARNGLDVQSEEDEGVYYASDDLYFLYPNTELQRHLRSIAYDEENTITYRFIKSNGVFYWQEVADTETSLILQKISALEVTTEGISAEVSAVALDLDTETQRIDGEVSLKLNTSDLVSEFNAKANVITLTSDNFRLDAHGNLWAQNVDIAGKLTAENGGNIGGWNVTRNTNLYADGSIYRAYMQKPTNADTWVFSVQENNGSSYTGNWFVTSGGIEKTQKLFVNSPTFNTNYSMYVYGGAYFSEATSNKITCGTFTTTASGITFEKKINASEGLNSSGKINANGGLISSDIIQQTQHGLAYNCLGTNTDVVFYLNGNNQFQVYVNNNYIGMLIPS